MNDGMQTTVLVSLISGLVILLLGVIGFGAKRWVDHVDRLQDSINNLRDSIIGLSDKFVTRDQHERDIRALQALGRRTTDRCPDPECPFQRDGEAR